ncbi:hypothetical protein MRX96_044678 [Rhipicephalus microplus]
MVSGVTAVGVWSSSIAFSIFLTVAFNSRVSFLPLFAAAAAAWHLARLFRRCSWCSARGPALLCHRRAIDVGLVCQGSGALPPVALVLADALLLLFRKKRLAPPFCS